MKSKVSLLAAKPLSVTLKHPVLGDTDIKVDLVGPHSKQFQDALAKFEALKPEDREKRENAISLVTACIVGWQEEDFGVAFSREAVADFFSDPANDWVINHLSPIVGDFRNFFRKPNQEAA